MIWFEGSISTAVQTSKSKNAIFVVYVEGKDENSNKMSEMINHPDASSKLESSNFVAVKLEAGSESYNQFVQIYQLVPVPSLFFIGKNGAPIEVIPQHLENHEFVTKLDKIMESTGVNSVTSEGMATLSSNLINSEIKASTSAEKPKPTEPINEESSQTTAEPVSLTNEELNATEKLEKAKQLIEEKRELKRLEEEEVQRKKELERRKMGQEIQKMRRQQHDQEMKQIREEIQREKNEELAARQKILAQIEQDKEERAKKFNQPTTTEPLPSTPVTVVEAPKIIPRNVNSARLQFRMADGSSHTKDFEPTNTLQEIRDYVIANLHLPYRNFDLSTTFPRRQFSAEDYTKTLTDLELIPNAVLLVVPVTGVAVTPAPPGSGLFSSFMWFFISPVLGVYGYICNKYNDWRNPRPAPFKRPSSDGAGPSGSTGPSLAKRRIPPDSTVIRRHGNVHRLGDRKDDSDEDNNTWNGNSTQQM